MAKCDLCNGRCEAHQMTTLLEQYRTPDVVELCRDCARWADNTKGALLREIPTHMRAAIAAKKGMPPPAAPTRWWTRLWHSLGEAFSA